MSANTSTKSLTALQQKFQSLPKRDKLALMILAIFLVCFMIGFAGWELHQQANKSKKSYDDTMSNVFWLRSQAGNIQANPNQNVNKVDSIRQILSQSGIAGQVVENGDKIQLNFTHNQSAVINNIFNQIQQQGLNIQQLQINQPTLEQLEVQAVLSLS